MDVRAALANLREQYALLGRDRPDLEVLLGAATLSLSHAEKSDDVTLPRWIVEELTRTLGRMLQDEGMLRNSKPRTRARRRPRETELPPLAAAKALAPHLARWKAVTLARARGLSWNAAYADASKEFNQAPKTIKDSYSKIEELRTAE